MNKSDGCKHTGIEKEYSIEDLAAFHGHLGPFIVLGYRMGRYAKKNFCTDPFQMSAVVYCAGTPPESCMADGIQIGSGCTLGKRNIEIIASKEIRCIFTSGERKLTLIPKPFKKLPPEDHDYPRLVESMAEEMYGMADSDLFEASFGCFGN
ncbi:MAG: formylmethanofuran dehydrogenase subunit E family protein [Methanothrix sp.]|nr:formylmethanofuran dehydrogenase subunit E family protein [Methanothrix sp.]